jgi:hypothetical protein
VKRVYIIGTKTIDSNWFKKAVKNEEWVNVWSLIKSNLYYLDIRDMIDTESINNNNFKICQAAFDLLVPKIKDKNNILINVISHLKQNNYCNNLKLIYNLDTLKLWDDLRGTTNGNIDYTKYAKDIESTYPFFDFNQLNVAYDNINAIRKIANYINAMDLFIDFNQKLPDLEKMKV